MAERMDLEAAERALTRLKDEKDLRGLMNLAIDLAAVSKRAAEDWSLYNRQDVYKLVSLAEEARKLIAKLKDKESKSK